MSDALHHLLAAGQSPWYDNLSRAVIESGELASLIANGIRGVTSNPTIFEHAMKAGDAYDDALRTHAARGADPADVYWDLIVHDIQSACDLFTEVHADSDGVDGVVSVEVAPDLAADAAKTVAMARDLSGRIQRPNLMIKIPATVEGLQAIEDTLADGISVNVTLIFGLDRYAKVMDAFVRGAGRYQADGGDLSDLHSVASFFVSRVDTEVDPRLAESDPRRGQAAVANAKLAYRDFLARKDQTDWVQLAASGLRPQRPLWASTSTKNPAYSPTLYVDSLIGPETVNTLAPASVAALTTRTGFAFDRAALRTDIAAAAELVESLAADGIDLNEVATVLEHNGVASFVESYQHGLETVTKRLSELS